MTPYTQFFCGHDGDALEVSTQRNPDQWFYDWATGGQSSAGVPVNGYTALSDCHIWQGINIIAGDIGQTPIKLVRNTFTEVKNHPAAKLLQLRPNNLQVPSTFIESLVQWALMWGQGCAWIQFQGSVPINLYPLRPDCLWKELIEFEGGEQLLYRYYSPHRNGTQYVFFPWEILDIPGLTSDGICGYELPKVGKETIGHSLALQKHGNATFANGAVPGGVVEAPVGSPLGIPKNEDWRKQFRSEWNEIHQGADKAGAIAILWEGLTYKATAHTNSDAQWLEAKKWSAYEAAALLNLPPHKLGAMEDSSVRANLEEQNADYQQRTLSRWYNRMAEEFRRKLLTEREWMSGNYEFVWDVEAFLKPDIDTWTTVLDRLVKATILNPNEARGKLRLPPREGGEEYGSPAINPNKESNSPSTNGQNSPDDANEPPKPPPVEAKAAHRELLYDRTLHFFEREALSLKQAAAKSANFVAWLDEFYLGMNGSEPKILNLCETVCGTSIRACCAAGLDARNIPNSVLGYAKTRHAQLLEACSTITKEQLPEAVERVAGENQSLTAQGLLATALGDCTKEA